MHVPSGSYLPSATPDQDPPEELAAELAIFRRPGGSHAAPEKASERITSAVIEAGLGQFVLVEGLGQGLLRLARVGRRLGARRKRRRGFRKNHNRMLRRGDELS